LPLALHLNARSIETAMDMMREDRSAAFRVAAEATPERYVDVGFLGEAQQLAGVPRRAMARVNQMENQHGAGRVAYTRRPDR